MSSDKSNNWLGNTSHYLIHRNASDIRKRSTYRYVSPPTRCFLSAYPFPTLNARLAARFTTIKSSGKHAYEPSRVIKHSSTHQWKYLMQDLAAYTWSEAIMHHAHEVFRFTKAKHPDDHKLRRVSVPESVSPVIGETDLKSISVSKLI